MQRPSVLCLLALLLVSLFSLSACGREDEPTAVLESSDPATPTAVAPLVFTPTAVPTATSVPSATPLPPTAVPPTPAAATDEVAAELEQWAAVNLGLDPGTTAEGIAGVHAFPMNTDQPEDNLWLVYTYGMRSFEPEQFHLLVVYRQDAEGWREVASAELSPITPAEVAPDFIGENSVQQVQVEPTNLWVQVEGGVGAHGGVYALYRFDGQSLQREVLSSNAQPPAGQLDDLNGDGTAEVVLDASDYYVFCYACSVRYAQYNILRWDGTRMTTVSLAPLAETAPALLQEANQAAITLATAGLWKDAEAAIDKGSALNVEDPVFEWNAVYIQYNAEAKAAATQGGNAAAYPILDNLFYGDYEAAVEVMRSYAPDEIFALRTPLIIGTPAEGAAQQLANRILSSVEPALKVRPNLAAAYYLRGWASFLKNGFADENVLADVERAAQLAANDRLFADTVAYFGGDPSTLSLSAPRPDSATVASATLTTTTPTVAVTSTSATLTATETITTATVATPTTAGATNISSSSGVGRIYYSGQDLDGHSAIFVVAATPGAAAERVVPDAVQPAVQPGGARLAFHTTRDDMLGLGGFDLNTGERVRYTFNVEDTSPTWSPTGDQLFFASTRYGDGRWRLYQVWADGNAEATDMRYGQDPAWHPRDDQLVYKGCDDAGGHCGLWLMRSDGTERRPLTDNPGDARPRWAPNGNTVVFMSDQRDGNWEVYILDVANGTVVRLTENAAGDGLPVVSPDGTTVAFVSDRDGSWAIWTAPLGGGVAEQVLPLGELPNWLEQGLEWVE